MAKIRFCPMVGGPCNKSEPEIKMQVDTFFLAEPFKTKQDRKRRAKAVKTAIKDALGRGFSENSLKIADKDPTASAVFCDICRMIQSSAYGIADISRLNPNVLIELGMMFSLGKPVFILVKKNEEEDLKKKLPSDIPWKRVVPYEDFIDVEEELSNQIKNRPEIKAEPSLIEETQDVVAKIDSSLAQTLNTKIKEFSQSQQEWSARLESLLKEAKLNKPLAKERAEAISPSLEKQIQEILEKLEQREKITGFPENPGIALLRGNFYYERKEYEKALELYDWAITLRPKFAEAWHNKGVALDELERYEEAIACYDKAIKLKPDDVEAWNNKGVALGKLEKYEEAIACCDKAIKLKPDDGEAWYNKGVSLGKLEKYEEAIACYDKAIKLKPDDAEAWYNKGVSLGKLEKYEEAIACCDKAIKLKPDNAEAWSNKGLVLSSLERYEEAIACYDKAIKLKPDLAEAWYNKEVALSKLEKYEEAIACCDKAIKIKPDNAEAWSNKGLALSSLERYEEAIACYDKAIKLKPDLAEAWYNKGVALSKLGRYEEARQCYEEPLRIDPNDVSAIMNLSEVLLILGDIEEALKRINEGINIAKKEEDKAICQFLQISALTLKGKREQASRKTQQLINYLRELKKGFKVTKWDFSPLLSALEKLSRGDKKKVFSLISLLKGESTIKEFEKDSS